MRRNRFILYGVGFLVVSCTVGGYYLYRRFQPDLERSRKVILWLRDPDAHPEWRVSIGIRCNDAPFLFPTEGFIGYLWGDSFRLGHRHQGIDIFAGKDVGIAEVRAAYAGYLTRLPDWKSSLIIRIPHDPLMPQRQVWIYYTHLADPQGNSLIASNFPPGTQEVFVEAGTLLGYQGNYSGNPANPVGVHLHFSIVKDHNGHFMNELEFANTLDPSPYFGLPLNAAQNRDQVPVCLDSQ